LDNFVLNVRYNFLNFFNSFLNDNIINKFLNFNYLDLFLLYRNNLFTELINLLNLPVNYFDWNHLFNNSIDWNLNFDWYDDIAIDFDYFRLFNNIGDNLLDFNSSRNFSILNHNSFGYHFFNFSILLVNLISHQDFSDDINWSFDFQVNVSRGIDLNYSFLEHRIVYDFLNFNYLRDCNNLLYYFFNDLRDFNYLLDYSRDNDNFFNNFLNFNHFWYLNKFLDDFLDQCWNCFDSFDDFLDWNNSILDNPNNLRLFDKVIDDLFYFLDSVLVENFGDLNFELFMNKSFNYFDDRLFDEFLFDLNDFLNYGNLNDFFNDFFDSFIFYNRFFNYSLNIFDPVSVYYFLDNNLDLNRFFNNVMDLNYLLYDSWNLDNFLNNLNDRNDFFDDSIYRFISNFNVISDVWSGHILDSFNDLLNNFLNFHNFWNLNSDFDNFLNDLIDCNRLLYDFFCGNNFLSHKLNVSVLSHRYDDFLLNLSVSLNLNWNFNFLFNFNNFRYFSYKFDNFFNNLRYFNNSLLYFGNFNQFLYN
jgi:hypothetical protein